MTTKLLRLLKIKGKDHIMSLIFYPTLTHDEASPYSLDRLQKLVHKQYGVCSELKNSLGSHNHVPLVHKFKKKKSM